MEKEIKEIRNWLKYNTDGFMDKTKQRKLKTLITHLEEEFNIMEKLVTNTSTFLEGLQTDINQWSREMKPRKVVLLNLSKKEFDKTKDGKLFSHKKNTRWDPENILPGDTVKILRGRGPECINGIVKEMAYLEGIVSIELKD